MKTLILQSYRVHDVPAWVAACLDSCRRWATESGFDYEFVDDAFFDYAPDWIRARRSEHFYPVTDIARLYLLRDRLSRGYHRGVWVDADVVVFDPARLAIGTRAGYAFAHEIVPFVGPGNTLQLTGPRLNNAVIVMERGCPMLDYYIFAAEEILRHRPLDQWGRTMIGPDFLIQLSTAMPVERLTAVGLFTPPLLADVVGGSGDACRAYRRHFGFHLASANLCHFMRGEATEAERAAMDRLFERAVHRLIETRGEVINRFAA